MRILAKLMNFFWGFCKELKKKKMYGGGEMVLQLEIV